VNVNLDIGSSFHMDELEMKMPFYSVASFAMSHFHTFLGPRLSETFTLLVEPLSFALFRFHRARTAGSRLCESMVAAYARSA
jgi:hypothetical protein